MVQREVQDSENVRWVCVQAFSQGSEALEEKAEEVLDGINVVCTPTGGAQTVRIKVEKDWDKQLSDEELLQLIEQNK